MTANECTVYELESKNIKVDINIYLNFAFLDGPNCLSVNFEY